MLQTHQFGVAAVVAFLMAHVAIQDPPPGLDENTNHVDHDCHWNEHTEATEYHSRWYESEITPMGAEYSAGSVPAGTPSWGDRIAAEIIRMSTLIDDNPPCWARLSQLDIYRNARMQRLNYVSAHHTERQDSWGMNSPGAGLSWVPSPTWRADITCCHGDDCSCNWNDTVDFTIGPMIGVAGNPLDYPMEGEIRVAYPAQPAYTAGTFNSDGCWPLGIPARQVRRDTRFYFRRLRWRMGPDQDARLVGEGYSQTYSQDTSVAGDQFDADGPATQYPVSTPEEAAQYSGSSVAQGTIQFPFNLTEAWIHKSTVTLTWTNYIPNQMARARNTTSYVGVLFTPTTLRLGDAGVNNIFTTP